jgi:carboxymethylenebutenolidase
MTEIQLPYFLSQPATEPPWPGIVVIHEGNGISSQLLRVCQRLSAEGYAAIAPDLFFRAGGTEAGDFATLMGSLDVATTRADLEQTAGILRGLGAGSVGVTGFCMGGLFTYRAAVTSREFDAAASFYGARIAQELATPSCPTLLFFGGRDPWIPEADIEAVRAHHPSTVVYPEAAHGFMRDGSESYDEAAATDAWARLLAFFGEHLHRASRRRSRSVPAPGPLTGAGRARERR